MTKICKGIFPVGKQFPLSNGNIANSFTKEILTGADDGITPKTGSRNLNGGY